ncbi:MAG: Flp family type IVb pilin [Alphaproteobacteria bacterium]|nr:Flp family type IVb pilin [Alphaproteobacteria bacterium]MBF0129773.1 Flp family type IVb pilin [Alphaproteobacteria bacterium]
MSHAYLNGFASKARAFLADESGATAIEYGLIAAGIAVAIVTAVFTIGDDLNDLFGAVSGKVQEGTALAQ